VDAIANYQHVLPDGSQFHYRIVLTDDPGAAQRSDRAPYLGEGSDLQRLNGQAAIEACRPLERTYLAGRSGRQAEGGGSLEPNRAAVDSLIEHLNHLRLAAGNPSLRRLARLSNHTLTRRTLHDHFSGVVKMPSWAFVAAYYAACLRFAERNGQSSDRLGTLDNWADRYRAALIGDSEGACPVRDSRADREPATTVALAVAELSPDVASHRRGKATD
jgi:hypothetical protein